MKYINQSHGCSNKNIEEEHYNCCGDKINSKGCQEICVYCDKNIKEKGCDEFRTVDKYYPCCGKLEGTTGCQKKCENCDYNIEKNGCKKRCQKM